jgi:hypothetical protein
MLCHSALRVSLRGKTLSVPASLAPSAVLDPWPGLNKCLWMQAKANSFLCRRGNKTPAFFQI